MEKKHRREQGTTGTGRTPGTGRGYPAGKPEDLPEKKDTGARRPEEESFEEKEQSVSQLEDKVMKTAAQFFGEDLLPYLGIREKIRRVAPTEYIRLEARRLEEDFNFEMEDGSYRHLEFESDRVTTEDLRRFREYEAYLGMVCQAPVQTVVICSANVKRPKTELRNGESVYRVRTLYLKEKNGDRLLELLEKRERKGKRLGRKRLFPMLLTPLMAGESPIVERICRGVELLRSRQADVDRETRKKMETILYALAVKLLDAGELEKVKEKIGMTLLGEMLVADGMEKGLKEGVQLGRAEGGIMKLISQIHRKIRKGLKPEEIADQLEEDPGTVRELCNLLEKKGPGCSDEEICREYLQGNRK